MRQKVSWLLICILLTACGTHRKVVSTREKDKTEVKHPVKKQTDYNGKPWTSNMSRPFIIDKGLQNRHLSVWASHGRYFDQNKNRWTWQRPYLFCTNEDLYTQTIVVPYLIPMLENAGAIVFTPRERDWQRNEIIVDNDDKVKLPYYTEINIKEEWKSAGITGFARNKDRYDDGTNPFKEGTTRMAKASADGGCEISYQPNIPAEGEYAVYVSYPTHKRNVPDAQYIVWHKGRKTVFNVNQQMGGGTWVYLGTFDFAPGCSNDNRVVLTNVSKNKGVVTADAVRFGGGMGNISRGGQVSGLPRCLEGARYYARWAGAPDSVCLVKNGSDDYKEDIYARPYMTNWLAGGSCYMPETNGLNVPIELALAIHSDAGFSNDYSSLVGTLSICTTDANNGILASGMPRYTSKRFAKMLLDNTCKDIKSVYSKWNKRELYDRNYAETRCPEMTSAILETMSHQNFPDMVMGQDPNFRFTYARSIYKSILRFTSELHDRPYVVTPLTPTNFRVDFCGNDTVLLSWDMQRDATEPTAIPKAYVLYTATGNSGFDNGIKINGTACKIKLQPGTLYNFKISAVNDGGESFKSEVISAAYNPDATKKILIINGFQRLSAPAIINDDSRQGFDFYSDAGVWADKTPGFSGGQICFDKTKIGIEGAGGLGFSGDELEGVIIKGNEFNYITTHAKAVMQAGRYNIASCSKYAVESGKIDLRKYDCVDLILGLEKDDGHSLRYYKTFTPKMQNKLAEYTRNNGNLIVSGAFVGSDMKTESDIKFLNNTLHLTHNGISGLAADNTIIGMSTSFNVYNMLNEEHYATFTADIISPVNPAFSALTDKNGNSVCVAYDGKQNRTFTMGFPFECITSEKKRASIMKGILGFIFK